MKKIICLYSLINLATGTKITSISDPYPYLYPLPIKNTPPSYTWTPAYLPPDMTDDPDILATMKSLETIEKRDGVKMKVPPHGG